MDAKVSIIMGSTSDMPIMEAACKFFDEETRSQMCTKECINCKFGTTNIYIVSVHI